MTLCQRVYPRRLIVGHLLWISFISLTVSTTSKLPGYCSFFFASISSVLVFNTEVFLHFGQSPHNLRGLSSIRSLTWMPRGEKKHPALSYPFSREPPDENTTSSPVELETAWATVKWGQKAEEKATRLLCNSCGLLPGQLCIRVRGTCHIYAITFPLHKPQGPYRVTDTER